MCKSFPFLVSVSGKFSFSMLSPLFVLSFFVYFSRFKSHAMSAAMVCANSSAAVGLKSRSFAVVVRIRMFLLTFVVVVGIGFCYFFFVLIFKMI